MRYTGINHAAMATGDLEGTIRFWRDLVGLRIVAGYGGPGYRHYFFEVGPLDMIAFFEWPGVEPIEEKEHGRPVKGPFAFDHLALGVEDSDALWEVKERFEAAGIWVSEVIDHGFIHSIYSFDPNGIAIEFTYYVEGVDMRAHPTICDKAPSGAIAEGPEPRPGAWPEPGQRVERSARRIYPGAGSEFF